MGWWGDASPSSPPLDPPLGGGVPLPTGEGSGEEAVWIERQFRRPRNDMSVLTVRSSVAVDGQNGHI